MESTSALVFGQTPVPTTDIATGNGEAQESSDHNKNTSVCSDTDDAEEESVSDEASDLSNEIKERSIQLQNVSSPGSTRDTTAIMRLDQGM